MMMLSERLAERHSTRGRLFMVLLVGLALAMALSMTLAEDAEARKKKKKKKRPPATSVSGSAGAATHSTSGLPGGAIGYQMNGSHHNPYFCESRGAYCYTPWVFGYGPTSSRSPATWGDQNIGAIYILQRWNGSYYEEAARYTHQRTIPAGVSQIQLPEYNIMKSDMGYYKVIILIGWYNAYNGQQLGIRSLVYERWGDYACQTSVRPCYAGAGYVYLG